MLVLPSKSSVYPLVRNKSALAYRSGVFKSPSLATSSPILSSKTRTAAEIFSIRGHSAAFPFPPISRLSTHYNSAITNYILTGPIEILGDFDINFARNYFITILFK